MRAPDPHRRRGVGGVGVRRPGDRRRRDGQVGAAGGAARRRPRLPGTGPLGHLPRRTGRATVLAGAADGPVGRGTARRGSPDPARPRARTRSGTRSRASRSSRPAARHPAGVDPAMVLMHASDALDVVLGSAPEGGVGPPALVAFDDLHAADPATLQLVAGLAAGVHRTRIVLALALRSGEGGGSPALVDTLAAVGRLPRVLRLDLGPLPAPAITELVHGEAADLEPAAAGPDRGPRGGQPVLRARAGASGRRPSRGRPAARGLRRAAPAVPPPARGRHRPAGRRGAWPAPRSRWTTSPRSPACRRTGCWSSSTTRSRRGCWSTSARVGSPPPTRCSARRCSPGCRAPARCGCTGRSPTGWPPSTAPARTRPPASPPTTWPRGCSTAAPPR